jgi:hypothetical protein
VRYNTILTLAVMLGWALLALGCAGRYNMTQEQIYQRNYCFYNYDSVDLDTGNYWRLLCRMSKEH